MNLKELPNEIINIILDFDGRIKYKTKPINSINYKKYINIIHKNDPRYNKLTSIINKKLLILNQKSAYINKHAFYFEFSFDAQPLLFLCYDFNWSYQNEFEICYTDMKKSGHALGSDQTRTIYH
jgi:hypothetical protein